MVIWHHHISSHVTLCARQVNFPDVEKVEWVNKVTASSQCLAPGFLMLACYLTFYMTRENGCEESE